MVTDDKADARNRFRASFAPYYATPVYNAFLAWAGYRAAAETITEGWAQKDRGKTSGALSNELIDEIAIIGDEEECRARLLEDAEGGIHTHFIAPLSVGDSEETRRTFEAFTGNSFALG